VHWDVGVRLLMLSGVCVCVCVCVCEVMFDRCLFAMIKVLSMYETSRKIRMINFSKHEIFLKNILKL
jgi:hypothetical protein